MTIREWNELTKNTNEIKINKIKNGVGNYSYQFYDNKLNKWIIGCFKNYTDIISLSFFNGFTKEKSFTKFILLERE